MGKLAVIIGVFLGVLCSIAQAHRPVFSDKAATDPNTAVLISQPAISQVIYREITDEAEQVWLAFDVNEGFDLFIQIGVPVLDRLKKFRPAMVVVGPGMPQDDFPFGESDGTFLTDDVEEPRFFHEHFTGTDSWILRSDTVKIPKSGRYYLVAYVPSGDKGKLWLSVGKKESFGLAEWAQFGEWKKKIRTFHEVSETGGGLRIPILSDIGDRLKSGGSLKSTAEGTIVKVKLTDNGQALINPDMGWTMHYYSNIITNYGSKLEPSDTLEDFPGLSTVYLRVPWAFIEPEEGNYNWSLLDTPSQRWIDKGKRIAIRLTTSENWMRYATPEWVKKAGAKGYFYQYGQGRKPTGPSWDPDFNDPIYLEKLDTLLANMAKRYDNNPNVAFIDIGTFGLWGEGHTHASSQVPDEILYSTQKKHIDLHLKHFKNTLLCISDDFAGHNKPGRNFPITDYALKNGITLRDDSIMVQPPPNSWYHAELANSFWPKFPVILEHEHYGSSLRRNAWVKDLWLKSVEDYHASYMSIHWWPRVLLNENKDAIDKINRRLGYRICIKEASWPESIKIGIPFEITTIWKNAGVAPCYPGGYIAFTIKDDKKGIVSTHTNDTFNVRDLQPTSPGKEEVKTIITKLNIAPRFKQDFKRNVRPGQYDLYISVGKLDATPTIHLPHNNEDNNKRYRLGKINLLPR